MNNDFIGFFEALANECTCENSECAHGDFCTNPNNPELQLRFLGAVCKTCYDNYPDRFKVASTGYKSLPLKKRVQVMKAFDKEVSYDEAEKMTQAEYLAKLDIIANRLSF